MEYDVRGQFMIRRSLRT